MCPSNSVSFKSVDIEFVILLLPSQEVYSEASDFCPFIQFSAFIYQPPCKILQDFSFFISVLLFDVLRSSKLTVIFFISKHKELPNPGMNDGSLLIF